MSTGRRYPFRYIDRAEAEFLMKCTADPLVYNLAETIVLLCMEKRMLQFNDDMVKMDYPDEKGFE